MEYGYEVEEARVLAPAASWPSSSSAAAGALLSHRLHVPVEVSDEPVDRALLDQVGTGGPIGQRQDVAVQRVIPGHPLGVLAALYEELVADAEDPLEMVAVPAHDQD